MPGFSALIVGGEKEGFNPFLVPIIDDVPDLLTFPMVEGGQTQVEMTLFRESRLEDLEALV